MRTKPIQSSSSSLTSSASKPNSTSLHQNAESQSSVCENLLSYRSDFPDSLGPYCGTKTSYNDHPYPKLTHPIRHHESVSSLSPINVAELPYHSLDKISRPPTRDAFLYLLVLDAQILTHHWQHLSHSIFPVNRINSSLQYANITRSRDLKKITQLSVELKVEVTNVRWIISLPYP